jgi:hypothetical protein
MTQVRVWLGAALMLAWLAGSATAASIEPVRWDNCKGPSDTSCIKTGDATTECGQLEGCSSDYHYKFDNWGSVVDGPHTVDGGNIINITKSTTDNSFSWSSAWPVACVLVKGGDAYNVYCYPEPVTSDSGLFAPVNASGGPAGISHVTFCYSEPDTCYSAETAWASGTRYVSRGNWAMYVSYSGAAKTVDLFAGQTINVGTATFSAPGVDGKVTITINLTGGAIFYYDGNDPVADDNLKVQDYTSKPPAKNPAPGLFAWKTTIEPGSTTGSIVVPSNSYYGVHLDVAIPVPCTVQ